MPESPEKAAILRDIGFIYSRTSIDESLKYFWKAYSLGDKIDDKITMVSVCSQLTILYNNLGNTDSTDYYLAETKRRAEVANKNKGWSSYYQSATLVHKKRKNYDEAIKTAKKNVEYNLNENPSNLAGSYLNLANIYVETKQYKNSIPNYFKALNLFESIQEQRGIAYTYNSLSNVYDKLGQYKEALKYAKLSLEIKKKQNDEKGIATSYQVIGSNYLGIKEFDNALVYTDKAIVISKKLNNTSLELDGFWQKARIYKEMKDTVNAAKNYDIALNLAKKLKLEPTITELNREKSLLQIPKLSDEQLALEQLKTAREKNDSAALLDNLDFLATYYYKKADYKKAFDYNQEYQTIRYINSGPEVLKQLKETESQLELQKKESSIQLLEKNREINERKLQNQKIAIYSAAGILVLTLIIALLLFSRNKIIQEKKRIIELEDVRKNIARDLHDDLGSTLSSIQIISNLAQQETGENPKVQQAVTYINELSNKVSTGMREIVWSVNPEHDRLKSIVEHMRKIASETLAVNDIHFTLKDKLIKPKKEISPVIRKELLMIYREALNNALKYSQTKNVDIRIIQTKKNFQLIIKDYGKGFSADKISRGNGLNNMEARAKNLNGKININSKENEGTTIDLKFPLP